MKTYYQLNKFIYPQRLIINLFNISINNKDINKLSTNPQI